MYRHSVAKNLGSMRIVPYLLWFMLVTGSLAWNIYSIRGTTLDLVRDRAVSSYQFMVTVRHWNSLHNGVYVPVSSIATPNPYLVDPERDLLAKNGKQLTKVNPSAMTAQLAELMALDGGMVCHLASTNPIRPENRADSWEEGALREFEKGLPERFELIDTGTQPVFRYIAPIRVDVPCLKCHAAQGYRYGEIRGGLSVTFPATPFYAARQVQQNNLAFVHLAIFFCGVFGIAGYQRRLMLAHQALARQSLVDELTGLYNRRGFMEFASQMIRIADRAKSWLVLCYCDLDEFKAINDQYGHAEGDQVLRETAVALRETMRASDIVARLGGDEFAVLMAASSEHEIQARLQAKIDELNGQRVGRYRVGISFGCVRYEPGSSCSLDELMKRADQCMYEQKNMKKQVQQ